MQGSRVKRRLRGGHFTVSHIIMHRTGVVQFRITVHHPGVIDVVETAWQRDIAGAASVGGPQIVYPASHRFTFARAHLTPPRPGAFNVTLTPNSQGKHLIEDHQPHAIHIPLWITYRPTGGTTRKQGFIGLYIPHTEMNQASFSASERRRASCAPLHALSRMKGSLGLGRISTGGVM